MRISFCVPTYNRAEDLKRCLDSILSNPEDDIEVVVQDNCSPDHTPAVVESFTDSRLKYWRNPQNIGSVQNAMMLIPKTTGSYLFFLTDDDYLLPGALAKLQNFIIRHEPVFFTSNTRIELATQQIAVNYATFDTTIERSVLVTPDQTARIIMSAHILTRVCFQRSLLDLDFFYQYGDNWYPQMLIAMQISLKGPLSYLAETLTVHAGENPTYWGINPYDSKTLNQGIANLIRAMIQWLDPEILENLIFYFFRDRNTFFQELYAELSPEGQARLRQRLNNLMSIE